MDNTQFFFHRNGPVGIGNLKNISKYIQKHLYVQNDEMHFNRHVKK